MPGGATADLAQHGTISFIFFTFSAICEQHVERLRAVMKAIRLAGLTIKLQKYHFSFRELLFLGHVVSSKGIHPDPEKTAAVEKFPKPTDKKAVRQFLELLRLLQTLRQKFFKDC